MFGGDLCDQLKMRAWGVGDATASGLLQSQGREWGNVFGGVEAEMKICS